MTSYQSAHEAQPLPWVFTWDPHILLPPSLSTPCSCPLFSVPWFLVQSPDIPWGCPISACPSLLSAGEAHENILTGPPAVAKNPVEQGSHGGAWTPGLSMEHDGGEANSRNFQMRYTILIFPPVEQLHPRKGNPPSLWQEKCVVLSAKQGLCAAGLGSPRIMWMAPVHPTPVELRSPPGLLDHQQIGRKYKKCKRQKLG